MPIITIEAISVTTAKGHKATLTGVNPNSTDALVGTVEVADGRKFDVRWDTKGTARDNDGSFNLVMSDDESGELADLREYAIHSMVPSAKQFL